MSMGRVVKRGLRDERAAATARSGGADLPPSSGRAAGAVGVPAAPAPREYDPQADSATIETLPVWDRPQREGWGWWGAAVLVALSLVILVLAVERATGADARHAQLPAALSRVASIERIYPELHLREIARKGPRSWERLRRAARTAWMRSHPCADATLARRYRLGVSSWAIVEATWRCSGQSPEWIATRRCLADKEGGRTYPDVRFGGGRGNPTGRGARNVVFGHLQIRPGWYRGALEGRRGVYAGDYWTPELYEFARHPINQARVAERIGISNYATASLCS